VFLPHESWHIFPRFSLLYGYLRSYIRSLYGCCIRSPPSGGSYARQRLLPIKSSAAVKTTHAARIRWHKSPADNNNIGAHVRKRVFNFRRKRTAVKIGGAALRSKRHTIISSRKTRFDLGRQGPLRVKRRWLVSLLAMPFTITGFTNGKKNCLLLC